MRSRRWERRFVCTDVDQCRGVVTYTIEVRHGVGKRWRCVKRQTEDRVTLVGDGAYGFGVGNVIMFRPRQGKPVRVKLPGHGRHRRRRVVAGLMRRT